MDFTQHLVFQAEYKISEKGFVASLGRTTARAVSQ